MIEMIDRTKQQASKKARLTHQDMPDVDRVGWLQLSARSLSLLLSCTFAFGSAFAVTLVGAGLVLGRHAFCLNTP